MVSLMSRKPFLILFLWGPPNLSAYNGSQSSGKDGQQGIVRSVVQDKFMCLMHSETKQTEQSEFGAGKVLLQGQERRIGGSGSKPLNSPMAFEEEFL